MITQEDVAERAGVSATTVSHVINETRFVSQDLRERVQRAMEELDYQPNVIARSLRRQRTHNIAVILPDIAYPFFAEVARGIEDEGFHAGYKAILCTSQGDREKERACLRLVRTKQVDGVILVAGADMREHVETLVHRGTPVVVCNRPFPGIEVNTVIVDDEDCGFRATSHLIALGHRRIGCITGPAGLPISAGRVEGYRRALETAGIPIQEDLVVEGDFRNLGGFEAMNQLLALDGPPTAVFACNDLMAMGAICAASKQRLKVPDGVAIVGCDDIALAAFTNPSLTTVRLPKREMGATAVRMLVGRIEDESRPVQERVLPTELVVRDSC